MSGNASQSETISEYSSSAYRSTDIPRQKPLEDPGGAIKALEGGDLIERLSWAAYSGLNISLSPSSAETFKERAVGEGPRKLAGPSWTHRVSPKDLIKTRWQLLLMVAGAFADYFTFGFFMACGFGTFLVGVFKEGFFMALQYGTWPMAAIAALHLFFRYPFTWLLERNLDFIIKDLGCGFFRPTGMVKFRTWREETFEAPFIEFDPYISYHVQPKGPVSYKLQLRHRYSGWQTAVAEVHSTLKVELYAHWDELQRYMDVTQPLPDIPALEPYRHLDPTTAEFDAAGKRERPSD
ncbi:hypothetical protein LCGC14_1156690 [marine sediment metagenome]|uniref:Uncharacterized protein n=2 Tax=root TaxID=1 RepID=A0A831R5V2_9GAMM|nr:hypothetical protein [Marinobacter antarcticus]HEA52749.1 hypothetical protein [Marinobacter antarcticus]